MLSAKTFFQAAALLLFIVGAIHLMRLFTGWEVVINGWTFPMWLSIFGVAIPWYLSYNAFMLSKKKNTKK